MDKKRPERTVWYGQFPTGIEVVDSYEESMFSYWCYKLFQEGYIRNYEKGETYNLSTVLKYPFYKKLKTKHKLTEGHLMNAHEYTPDFKILWSDKAKYVFFDPRNSPNNSYDFSACMMAEYDNGDFISIVEVKPVFDQNNMTRLATINIKWVRMIYGIYINLCIPMPKMKSGLPASTLFKQTFFPAEALLTAKGQKAREIKFKYRLFDDYIIERNTFLETIIPVTNQNMFEDYV